MFKRKVCKNCCHWIPDGKRGDCSVSFYDGTQQIVDSKINKMYNDMLALAPVYEALDDFEAEDIVLQIAYNTFAGSKCVLRPKRFDWKLIFYSY